MNYVRLRRERPSEQIDVAVSSGLDWILSNSQTLKDQNIPEFAVVGTLDADPKSVSELCLLLLEKLVERGHLEKDGETHLVRRGKALSDGLVDYLICMMLDAMDWNSALEMNRDLIVLIRHRLGGVESAFERQHTARQMRVNAGFLAGHMILAGQTPSFRSVAKAMGVNASTVMRWFFPSTKMGQDADDCFEAVGLKREHWADASPIRAIFKAAFASAGLPNYTPHSFRHMIVSEAYRRNLSPRELIAWSQNLGHESLLTTITSYGKLPTEEQGRLIRDAETKGPESEVLEKIRKLIA